MSEEAELQARIAALAGRINQQKQTSAPSSPHSYHGGYHAPQNRWTPYSAPHQPSYPRGGRGGYHKPTYPTHRNMSLVVNNNTPAPGKAAESPATPKSETPGWVSKRDRGHMQLINTSVYDQKMQQKQLDMQETAKEKQRLRNDREKNKVISLNSTANARAGIAAAPGTPRDIVINDLRFRVAADGSKLIRVFDDSNKDAQTTPKQAKIAGVTFHRSKNGNLYRAGLVKKKNSNFRTTKSTKLCPKFSSTGTEYSTERRTGRSTNDSITRDRQLLMNSVGRPQRHVLTHITGMCPLGPNCRLTHDINKIAICPTFLRQGQCAAGEECNLSHDPTPNRVPICIHFIRGNCTKEDCIYLHVRPSPSAPVCRDFATLGYCEKGLECGDRHVNECPSYANTGTCRDAHCRLPHVDTVANKRRAEAAKAAGRQSTSGPNNSSDLSSDEEDHQEIDSDDVDSDDMDEDMIMSSSGGQSHELAQQQDFIAFS